MNKISYHESTSYDTIERLEINEEASHAGLL
jgi:hypothetical protein